MSESQFHRSLKRYLKGTASEGERKQVERFYDKNQKKSVEIPFSLEERGERKSALLKQIREDKQIQRRQFIGQIARIAASILLLLAAGYWVFNSSTSTLVQTPELLTFSTERGERKTINLPDGSIVKLNARSSISFLESFEGSSTREVQLTGEAFFDVQRNEDQPFIVSSGVVQTKVLGTSFNIDARPGESTIDVTVSTGKVEVSLDATRNVQLVPGDRARVDLVSEGLIKSKVDLDLTLAWSKNQIIFKETGLAEAFQVLADWYDVDIKYNLKDIASCDITGNYGGSESLSNILESMEFINGLTYEWESDTILLIKGTECSANEE